MRLTSKQVGNTFKLLREHITPIHGSDLFQYQPGWSDSAIGKEVGIGTGQVRAMRKEAFGDLPGAGRQARPGSLAARVKILEDRMAQLEAAYNGPLEDSDERVHSSAYNR